MSFGIRRNLLALEEIQKEVFILRRVLLKAFSLYESKNICHCFEVFVINFSHPQK